MSPKYPLFDSCWRLLSIVGGCARVALKALAKAHDDPITQLSRRTIGRKNRRRKKSLGLAELSSQPLLPSFL